MNEKDPSTPKQPHYLITERQLEDYVDKGFSYDDAFRHFGASPEEVEPNEEATPLADAPLERSTTGHDALKSIEAGPSLSLLGRAKALDVIMSMFNQHSKAIGAGLSRDYNDMGNRYGDRTDEVIDNMYEKTHRLGKQAVQALQVLSSGDSGIAMPPEVDYRHTIKFGLGRELGPGQARVSDREKFMTKAFRAAGTTKSKARRSRH